MSKPVLERIEQLMALATSPNEHEARTAALLAVQLMKKHKATPQPRRRSSPRGTKKVVDPPERIVAPLGGDCVHCGERYTRGANVFWFASKGGMHLKCFENWVTSRSR